MTVSYTIQPIPFWTFNNLDGTPAAGGKLFVRSSLNPTQPKIVYQDPNGMVPWTDPIIFDENGMAPGVFYWKIDSTAPQDLYYLFFTDNTGATTQDPGNLIWSDNVYPLSGTGGGGGGGGTIIQNLQNLFVNSSFINNIGTTALSPIANNTFIAPGAHSGLFFPDINFIQSGVSDALDTISFVPFTTDPGTGINPIFPDFLTDYYLRYQCLNNPVGEVYKGIQLPISKFVNNLSNQTFTLTFYARTTAGIGNQLNFFIYQYFGSGGSPSVSTPVDLFQTRTLTGSFVLYSITFTVPSTLGKTVSSSTASGSSDDATYLQIRYQTGVTTTIDIFKPMLFVGSVFPSVIYESVEEIEPALETWRTGDVRPTMNSFSNTTPSAGWIPLINGTIGSAASGATVRANSDTWLLYNLIWNNTLDVNCPVTGGKGGTSLSDWNANKSIALPNTNQSALVNNNGGGAGLGAHYGEATHTLTISEMPSHNHPGSTFSGKNFNATVNPTPFTAGNTTPNTTYPVNVALQGGNAPHNNIPPSTNYNMIMKL